MSMDSGLLENLILDILQQVLPVILDDEILEVTVTEEVLPDGSTKFTSTPVRGAVRLTTQGREAMRPLARSISRAVVNHITTHAQVDLVTGRIS